MKVLCYLSLLASLVCASNWFATEPVYTKWSTDELRAWLDQHDIKVPLSFDKIHVYDLVEANWQSHLAAYSEAGRHWSLDQFNRAQRAFQHVQDDSFDKWDESRLRSFLLEQGVVAPSGPREQLVVLARKRYRAYKDAVALYSSLASASASSTYARATDAAQSASKSVSSAVTQATYEVTRAFDETKDYMYSTWDENRLRLWLEEHGVVEAKRATTKDELMKLANDYHRKASAAVWESWSDSYLREWLIAHNLLKPTDNLSRMSLLDEMKKYYYSCTDSVWHTWSDFELKAWLVNHGFLRGDVQKSRDELLKMHEENYLSASESVWGAWTDSDICEWLLEHGYLENRSDVKNRKDLVDLINSEYSDASGKAASYLVWPDARLRAYLRERGTSEDALPTNRPGLLQETRIRWVQTATWAETIYAKLKEIVNNSVEAGEEKVARILDVLSGYSREVECYASGSVDNARECADKKKTQARSRASHKADEASEKVSEVRQRASETLARGRDKVHQAGDEL